VVEDDVEAVFCISAEGRGEMERFLMVGGIMVLESWYAGIELSCDFINFARSAEYAPSVGLVTDPGGDGGPRRVGDLEVV